jgi:hypothetical protein
VAKSVKDLPLTGVAYFNLKGQGWGNTKSLMGAAKACETVYSWAIAYHFGDFEEWPTQVEYAEFWKINERTVRRELERFHAAFPNEESPERLARWFISEVKGRMSRDDFTPALSVKAPDWALPAVA